MQADETILELQTKLASLEGALSKIQKRRELRLRIALCAAMLAVSFSFLYSQTSQGPLTLQSLAQRVTDLEKRVTNDEASGTNIPQTADTGTTPGKPGSTANSSSALEQRVSQLEISLTQVQSQVSSLEAGSGTGTTKGTPVISTVTTPFKVVDQSGHIVMTVGKANGANLNALELYNAGGQAVTELLAGTGVARINLADSNNAGASMGLVQGEHVFLSLTEASGHAVVSAQHKAMGLYLGAKEGADDVALDLEGGVGNLDLLSGQEKLGSFSVTKDGNGTQLQVDSSKGTAIIGNPSGKAFGLRLYPGRSSTSAQAGMLVDAKGQATVGVGTDGKWRAALEQQGSVGIVGVLDSSGQKFLSSLTNYEGGGGALQISNPAGQIVSLVDSNPTNNEGRAAFTDAGGQPLAKIGGAGAHGDVILGGNGKGFDLWTHMLTGLP